MNQSAGRRTIASPKVKLFGIALGIKNGSAKIAVGELL